MLNDTQWAFSDEKPADEYTKPVEGLQYLQIKKAEFNDDSSEYKLTLVSLTNNAFVNVRYWTDRVDSETGAPVPNTSARRTLISLKKALYGPDANGIPNPVDIIDCAVLADVKMSPSKTDPMKSFPRIYDYKPVPEEVAKNFGNPDQYSIPDEEGEASEEE